MYSRFERARRWCFTINNWVDKIGPNWQDYLKSKLPNVRFLVCEEEHVDKGTPHLQGYVAFNSKIRFMSVINKLGSFAHIEVARGSELDNYKYCTKENGNVLQIGEPRQSVEKYDGFDWGGFINDFLSMPWDEFVESYPRMALQYRAKLHDLAASMEKPQPPYNGNLKCKNYWIWGPPRTGKSRWARSHSDNIYLKLNNKWWQFYNKEEVVLMEDFPSLLESNGALGSHMKLWADRYSFTAEQKNSSLIIHPKSYVFIVTSNYSIEQCFKPGDVEAIKSRFNEIYVEKNDLLFEMVLEIYDILHFDNTTEDHALHCT